MAATYVDRIAIAFGVDAKEVARGMKEAEKAIGGGLKKITSILMPIAGGFALKGMVDTYRNTADSLGKLSESIGVNMQDLDAWGMAAKLSGGSAEGLQGSVETLNQRLQVLASTGKGPAKAALDALGISATDAAGKAKQPMDVLMELAEQAENMDKAKFVGLAGKLGIDKGTIMLLQQGKMSVQELTDKMKKYTYTKEDARTAEKYNDALDIMSWSFNKLVATLMEKVLPTFTRLTDGLTTFFDILREHTPVAIGFLSALAVVFGTKLVFAIRALNLAWMTSPVTLIVTAIVAAIAAITLVIDDFLTWLDGGESYFEDQWQAMADAVKWLSDAWEWVKQKGSEFIAWLEAAPGRALDFVSEKVGEAAATISNKFHELWEGAKQKGGDFIEWFTGLPERVSSKLGELVTEATAKAKDLGAALKESFIAAFKPLVDPVLDIFRDLWEKIKGVFSGIGKFFKDKIKDAIPNWLANKIFSDDESDPDTVVRDVGEGIQQAADAGTVAAQSSAAKGGDTTIDNSRETQITNNVTVNATSDNPAAIGGEVADQTTNRMVKSMNNGVNI